jgi:hypothetical protein
LILDAPNTLIPDVIALSFILLSLISAFTGMQIAALDTASRVSIREEEITLAIAKLKKKLAELTESK